MVTWAVGSSSSGLVSSSSRSSSALSVVGAAGGVAAGLLELAACVRARKLSMVVVVELAEDHVVRKPKSSPWTINGPETTTTN